VSILVLATSSFVEHQRAALAALAPDERIHTDPATAPSADIEALLAFKLAAGIAPRFPALKFVACAGAGVDELLATPDLPAQVPVVRAIDPLQGQRMAQYVALMVLRFARELPRLEAQHAAAEWRRSLPADEDQRAVGVMGYGSIGAPVVDIVARLGYPVAVWTRTPRRIDGAESFAGRDALAPFLARSHILVCALPLTGVTSGMLGKDVFAALPRGAYVINVSRGAMLRESDLLAAVDAGQLAGAALDVFETEPLPATSPLWRHPRILCTPHISAMLRPEVAARQFLDNLHRARAGSPLVNVVDRSRGY
jgi:phosphoglycerate dehydrogenase-like enzyme